MPQLTRRSRPRSLRNLQREVDSENVEATYDNGVLSIHVPKTEESTPRQIEIQ